MDRISIKDRLPPESECGEFLVVDYGELYVARYFDRHWTVKCHCNEGTTLLDITHWMPLPSFPKEFTIPKISVSDTTTTFEVDFGNTFTNIYDRLEALEKRIEQLES